MINAMFSKMSAMSKEDMSKMYSSFHEETEENGEAVNVAETKDIKVEVDFKEDLNALVESEATLSDEFKAKTATIFEAAVTNKVAAEIEKLEENYKTELEEELKTTRDDLIEKVDSYLNYVVENWMEENKVAVANGLRTEIAENFMNKLKDVFTESYVEVPEGKVDLVDDLAAQVEELETKLNETTGKAISVSEELEIMKRDAIIREASKDLAETQVEKLKSLVDNIDYEDETKFAEKVKTIKESYFKTSKPTAGITEELDEDTSDDQVDVSGSMASYISAIKKSAKK
jgi:rRNA-processing protein FCF1